MRVREIMTENPACCTPDTPLREVARMMADCDCGEIPVVDGRDSNKPIGVVTDRDITCRTVAQGRNPLDLSARDAMTSPAVTMTPDASLEECIRVMEDRRIRRVPVVDESGCLCGIVAQADIARQASDQKVGEVVREVSEPTRVH